MSEPQPQSEARKCKACDKPAAPGKRRCHYHLSLNLGSVRAHRESRGKAIRASFCHSCGAQRMGGHCPFCEG